MTRTDSHRDRLEAFNRASHSDALREMQLTGLAESPPCEASYRYVDPIRPTPWRVIRSMINWRDFVVATTWAVLIVIVVPGVLLVLAP